VWIEKEIEIELEMEMVLETSDQARIKKRLCNLLMVERVSGSAGLSRKGREYCRNFNP